MKTDEWTWEPGREGIQINTDDRRQRTVNTSQILPLSFGLIIIKVPF